MNQTASDNAEEFGFHAGDLVQEWLWDDDVDDSIRAKIEELTGEELVDEDYDSAVDGVIIWWRDAMTRTNWPTPLSMLMRFSAMTARCGCSPRSRDVRVPQAPAPCSPRPKPPA